MQTKNKIFSFDVVIFCLLFGLLPVDMLNGFLLKEAGIESVVSISQVYKLILFFFIFIRICSTEKLMFISFFLHISSAHFYATTTDTSLFLY